MGRAAHLDANPSKKFGGQTLQGVIPAYQRCLDNTPFPLAANPFLAPEEGQVRGQVGEENTIVYPENPWVHWAFLSELVPPTNSDTSGDKCEGLSMTSRGDAEELRTWLQRMCCALAIPASSYFGGL